MICEIHILEPQAEEINARKIVAVKDASYTVAKRKPEKLQACRDSNLDLCATGAALRWSLHTAHHQVIAPRGSLTERLKIVEVANKPLFSDRNDNNPWESAILNSRISPISTFIIRPLYPVHLVTLLQRFDCMIASNVDVHSSRTPAHVAWRSPKNVCVGG